MPYTHINWLTLRNQLAARLDDTAKTYWVDAELGVLLSEALRTYGLLTGFWRERGTINTSSGTAFYDIADDLSSLLGYTVTDRNVIQALQYHLLESATSQTSHTGTEMFTYTDFVQAIERRRNQFLADTGCVVDRSLVSGPTPPASRIVLADTIIDVRRAAWLGAAPVNYYSTLWRDDERLLTAGDNTWGSTADAPEAYSVMAPPPLQLQIAPRPLASGQVELLVVQTGAALAPQTSATVLGIPDDLTPAIKWGALADLLSRDGVSRDPARAQFAESRYQLYVQLGRLIPVVLHAQVNGVDTIPDSLHSIDAADPDWQSRSGSPVDVAIAAPNLVVASPMPDGVHSITLDVVRKTPVPATDGTDVQIGREQLDAIIDYAEHLALFKVGGAEFNATAPQAQNFMAQCLQFNQRMSAAARTSALAALNSELEKVHRPRRLTDPQGVGAMQGTGG